MTHPFHRFDRVKLPVENLVAVFLGNAVGGAIFVGLAYYVSYGVPSQEACEVQ